MDAVIRATVIYAIVCLVFRVSGKRLLSETTNFDFVLLLIVGEATQQALLGDDFSVTNAAIVIVTLAMLDVFLGALKQRSAFLERVIDGLPLIVLEYGKPLKKRMDKVMIDETDILEAARRTQGLERLEQIRFAVLERSGGISIIPERGEK